MRADPVKLRQPLSCDQRREHELGHILRKRRNGRQDQRRRPANEHADRQRLAA
jgi:hypothetical protein